MGKWISLSFYLWFSHIATETASASDSLSINHLIYFFLLFFVFKSLSPLVQRAVLWPNQRQLAGRRIFLLFVVYALLVFFVCHHVIVFVE